MRFLLDTDHISILQRGSGSEFAAFMARAGQYAPSDLGFSVVSFHEQALGCHTYILRAGAVPKSFGAMGCLLG